MAGLFSLLGIKIDAEAKDKRDWYVVSTALAETCLLLECRNTGKTGVVNNPSEEEWNMAYHAPSNPYKWNDDSRVEIQQ